MISSDSAERLARARVALEGLSVGDSFGERFLETPFLAAQLIVARALPAGPWFYTDDTHMALALVAVVERHGGIDQDALAKSFAEGYAAEPWRGYGPAMHHLLPAISHGESWREAARGLFGGEGSYGNGAAMRVAPIGAYFADDLDLAVSHARLSAEVTHAHAEGIAGAVAVAVAAAWTSRLRGSSSQLSPSDFFDLLLPYVPESLTRTMVLRARALPPDTTIEQAVAALGNGSLVTAQDTVPFVLWCAAHHFDNFEDALWTTASGLGDIDTNCAIVGGIAGSYTGFDGIPADWLTSREPLPWRVEGNSAE